MTVGYLLRKVLDLFFRSKWPISPKTPKRWTQNGILWIRYCRPHFSTAIFLGYGFFICRVLVGDQQIVLMWNQECWLSKQSLSRDLVHRVFLGARKHEFCQPGLAIIFIPVMQLCQQIFPQNISALKWPGSAEGGPLDLSLAFFYMSKHGRYFDGFPYIGSRLNTGSQYSPWR